jgi:AcrR family transcriptional regulator
MTVNPSPNPLSRQSAARSTAAERARSATRARLLRSGRILFAEQGLHRITTHDIAAHAGVAAGTFYNHFGDKAALFREITDQALADLTGRLDAVALSTLEPEESVRLQATALVGFAADNRDLIRILFSREADAAVVETDVLQLMANRASVVRQQLVDQQRMPSEIDPDVFSQALVGMWSRVLAWWAEDTSRAPQAVVIETLTRIQLSGTHPGTLDFSEKS